MCIAKNKALDYKRKIKKHYNEVELGEQISENKSAEDEYLNEEIPNKFNEFISQNEIDEISKIQVDSNMLEKVKKRQVRSFRKVLLDNIFEEVGKNLENDEKVEFYVIGRNYTLKNIRLMLSLMGLVIFNPIFGWSTNNILINTNKRFIIVETVGYYL